LNQSNKKIEIPKSIINSLFELYSKGSYDEALKKIHNINESYPNVPIIFNVAGACYKALGNLESSAEMFTNAVKIQPDYFEAYKNLGITLENLNRNKASIDNLLIAISINPDYFDANYHLANVYQKLSQHENAVEFYEKAISINPNVAEAHFNLGNTLKELGDFDRAIQAYNQAIKIKPNLAEAHNNLGVIYKDLANIALAASSYESAIKIKPDFIEAHNNLGILYKESSQFLKAKDSFLKVIKLKPDYAEAHNNLGLFFMNLGQFNNAQKCYEKAFSLEPNTAYLFGALLNTKMHLCIWDDFDSNILKLSKIIKKKQKAIRPFALKALIDDESIQKRAAEIFVDDHFQSNFLEYESKIHQKHSKIRIGYFSADFKSHPVTTLTAQLYEMHDRNKFEVHAFSYTKDTKDKMSMRIKEGVDYFHDVLLMSNDDLVNLSRSLEIDIAVDLGGHTANSRTKVFAMSLAPIQLSYIGYLGTMGAPYYDYLIADLVTIPNENQQYYSEKIAYLPTYQVNDSTESQPEIFLAREDIGLPETGFVFCCFNNVYKITPTTFDSWMRILNNVEDSVLLLNIDLELARENLIQEAILRGVDPSRLIFAKRFERDQYLARYRLVDLFLDTLPYNAATTASDALRMGLPVLTCRGNSFASRMAASILSAINLPELITATPKEYESVAIELATNSDKFKIIKSKLHENLKTAPLFDTVKFTASLESVYEVMYQRYHNGLEPDHIYVGDEPN